MSLFTVAEAARLAGGELLGEGGERPVTAVSVDSRQVGPGSLFVALKGEHTDGHQFLVAAAAAGAVACLVSRVPDPRGTGPVPLILVADPLRALGDLATAHLGRCRPTVVGITGSVGKTSTKEMVASVLAQRWPVLKNPGNFNTEIGLPLALFQLRRRHRIAVLEMSMRGPGEITRLTEIAPPRVGVLTNIRETHLELLGSIEGIAAAKGELLAALPMAGTAVINGDDPRCVEQSGRTRARVVRFGLGGGDPSPRESAPEVSARGITVDGRGTAFTLLMGGQAVPVRLPLPGRHQAINALAAAAVGMVFGLEPEEVAAGLEGFSPPAMRMEVLEGPQLTIINDAYNASPTSTAAALETLRQLAGSGRAVAVLGDMLELGPAAAAGHRQVGEHCAALGIDLVLTSGRLSSAVHEGLDARGARGYHFDDNQQLIAALPQLIRPGDTVLVKGSRGMKMEMVVQALETLADRSGGPGQGQEEGGGF